MRDELLGTALIFIIAALILLGITWVFRVAYG